VITGYPAFAGYDDQRRLAGVLLGKTSLDWLYGLMNGRRELCHSFAHADSADSRAGDAAEMIKSLVF
jgi:hypothetical protein